MSAFSASTTYRPRPRPRPRLLAAVKVLADEVAVLVQALLRPGEIIREVETMRALHTEASRLEATDPAGAVALRQRASGIGLR